MQLSGVAKKKNPPWKLLSMEREIRRLYSSMDLSFAYIQQSTNGMADFLAKLGVDRTRNILVTC